jgi:hypothetical protein
MSAQNQKRIPTPRIVTKHSAQSTPKLITSVSNLTLSNNNNDTISSIQSVNSTSIMSDNNHTTIGSISMSRSSIKHNNTNNNNNNNNNCYSTKSSPLDLVKQIEVRI